MLTFTYPWLGVLLLLPIIALLLPKHRTQLAAIRFSRFTLLASLSEQKPSSGAVILKRLFWQRSLTGLSYLALVVATMRPVWLSEPVTVDKVGREMMVAVDLSGSMEAKDFVDLQGEKQRRIDGVKALLIPFLAQRSADRIGLIAFGDDAYLQAPFTQDKHTLSLLLQEMDVRMAGAGTALGDAIGVAVNHFSNAKTMTDSAAKPERKVLLLLTDGNDTSSEFPPLEAARFAAEQGIVIYPIAIGDPTLVGEDRLDMEMLAKIAALTQGQVFEAQDGVAFKNVYQVIEQLQPQLFDSFTIRPKQELYFWPLFIVLLGNLTALIFAASIRAKQGDNHE